MHEHLRAEERGRLRLPRRGVLHQDGDVDGADGARVREQAQKGIFHLHHGLAHRPPRVVGGDDARGRTGPEQVAGTRAVWREEVAVVELRVGQRVVWHGPLGKVVRIPLRVEKVAPAKVGTDDLRVAEDAPCVQLGRRAAMREPPEGACGIAWVGVRTPSPRAPPAACWARRGTIHALLPAAVGPWCET